jgi:aspartyl-tRNA(Asn)/glutamyl-tRNA(Gln) amidotransferase subunit B
MEYEAVIGLEVHVHLKTKSKAFCGCSTEYGREPNSQTCPVCLGFPGALPVFNRKAMEYAIKTALALNCKIQRSSRFDRKNYFYPDLPKNYQISQYELPLSVDGFLDIVVEGKPKRIGIIRLHLEEDAGKLIHKDRVSLVDFNRAGIPLIEIVTRPDIHSPQEAYEYLTCLRSILEYLEVSDCDMEKGSLRCDANVSVKKRSQANLGTKIELKNMNSFKAVKDALTFEISRQKEVLDSGSSVIQETRLWNEELSSTVTMRTKEVAQDYRYFPDPDLPPFEIEPQEIERIGKEIPELPFKKLARFVQEYGLSEYDAKILIGSKKNADYAEDLLKTYPNKDKKIPVNWIIGPLSYEANNRNLSFADLNIPGQELLELIGFVERQELSNLSAKSVLKEMIETKKSAATIIKEGNLIQISDETNLQNIVDEVIKENPKSAGDFKAGKHNALMFLVGQAMKKSCGKANPKVLTEVFKRRIINA